MPAKIFGDHMVPYKKCRCRSGQGAPREKSRSNSRNQEKSVAVDARGDWTVTLDPPGGRRPAQADDHGAKHGRLRGCPRWRSLDLRRSSNMQWTMKGLDKPRQERGRCEPSDDPAQPGSQARRSRPRRSPPPRTTSAWICRRRSRLIGLRTARWGHLGPFVDACRHRRDPARAVPGRHQEGLASAPTRDPLFAVLATRGVIWYQGENDRDRPDEYAHLIKTLIRSWRADWKEGDFPFLFVHLGAIGAAPTSPADGGWGPIRDAQLAALSLPNVEVASFHDSDSNLHPTKKALIGERLAWSPRPRSTRRSSTAVRVAEDRRAKAVSSTTTSGVFVVARDLRGFAIAGADGVFEGRREDRGRRRGAEEHEGAAATAVPCVVRQPGDAYNPGELAGDLVSDGREEVEAQG